VLRPTVAALNAGVRPGERAPTPVVVPPVAPRERADRASRVRERTPLPKTDGKAGRFDKGDFIPPPKALSLEDRIAGRLEAPSVPGELKSVRIVEGSTVKEFAEKLGIKPKDIVSLLLQRGVFATINQPLNDDVAIELGKRFGYDVTFVPFEE